MTDALTLVIRNGCVVDGTGAAPFEADVGISGNRIVEVGRIAGRGAEEIDARGLIVTPGFVDPHTHYDAQVMWANHITPSSCNGVTTALIGNCGVGFAPCKPDQREMLVAPDGRCRGHSRAGADRGFALELAKLSRLSRPPGRASLRC